MEIIIAAFLITLLCIAVWKIGRYQRDQVLRAKTDYERALFRLRNEPNNPELRARALELGRRYSFLCRDGMGIAIFDEVALMNELQAATTGRGSGSDSSKSSVEERLERLERLKQKGHISVQQYEAKKQKILDEL